MQTRIVKQYICEHCGVKKLSASHMVRHEKHCTMNPVRECRMCKLIGEGQIAMHELISIIPDPKAFEKTVHFTREKPWTYIDYEEAEKHFMPLLRKLTFCPVCIYSAIRQSGYAIGFLTFDLTKECQEIFHTLTYGWDCV